MTLQATWRHIYSAPIVRRVARGFGANIFVQAVVLGAQFVMVPVLAQHWGADRFGLWLLLFTVPSYLALGDFGFGTAAAVRMTMEVARGDRDAAVVTFQTACAAIGTVSLIISLLGSAGILLLPVDALASAHTQTDDVRTALLLLLIYGVVSLFSSLPAGGFRCVGLYAVGTTLQAVIMLAEASVAVMLVCAGSGITGVAFGYLATRTAMLVTQFLVLRALVNWLTIGFRHISRPVVRRLAGPAVAVMALPTAQAAFLQGSALVVGLSVSTTAVAVFITTRTLIRTGVQLTTLLNHAVMPEMTIAVATHDQRVMRRIILATIGGSISVVGPGAVVLLVIGTSFISFWTHGAIVVDAGLLNIMIAVMVVNGTWHPLSNLLLAANQQASYSYFYAACSITSVLVAWPLCHIFGTSGAALSILALDIIMLAYIGNQVWRRLWLGGSR